MSLDDKIIFYGAEQLYIAEILEDTLTGTTYGPLIWVEGVTTVNAEEQVETKDLPGDNGTIDTRSSTTNFDVELGVSVITHALLKTFKGGEIIETKDAEGNVVKRRWIQRGNDSGKYFGAICVTGDGEKLILPKVKASVVKIQHQTNDYAAVTVTAKALKRQSDGAMRIMESDANAGAPNVADFQNPVQS
jgi:hypothetical protein